MRACFSPPDGHEGNIRNFSIPWRDHRACGIWNVALRVAKKPEEKHGQQQRHQGPGRLSEPAYEHCSRNQSQRVNVAVTNHGSKLIMQN